MERGERIQGTLKWIWTNLCGAGLKGCKSMQQKSWPVFPQRSKTPGRQRCKTSAHHVKAPCCIFPWMFPRMYNVLHHFSSFLCPILVILCITLSVLNLTVVVTGLFISCTCACVIFWTFTFLCGNSVPSHGYFVVIVGHICISLPSLASDLGCFKVTFGSFYFFCSNPILIHLWCCHFMSKYVYLLSFYDH